jgi:hypothetical protein
VDFDGCSLVSSSRDTYNVSDCQRSCSRGRCYRTTSVLCIELSRLKNISKISQETGWFVSSKR